MRKKTFVLLAAAVVVGASGVEAQVVIGPNPSIFGNCLPFGCHDVTRYQQVYASSAFSSSVGSMLIGQVGFFYGSLYDAQDISMPLQTATYTFRFSTTQAQVNGLSTTLDDNVNVSPSTDQHLFGVSTVAPNTVIARGGTLNFVGTNPFFYDPATDGNLLLDILISVDNPLLNNFEPANTPYLDWGDGYFSSANDFSRAFAIGTDDDFFASGTYADDTGLVTEFSPTPTVVPEPTTIGLVATGLIGIAGAARRRRRQGLTDDSQ